MLPTVLSVLAIIISVLTPIINYALNQKLNKNDAIRGYLRDILSEPVFVELPTNILMIHLDGNKVTGVDNTTDTLREIRKKVLFYKHIDNKFYDKYLKLLQDLEDLLVETAEVKDDMGYVQFINKVTDYLNSIYEATAKHLF